MLYTKISSKQIKYLPVRPETKKLLEAAQALVFDFGLSNIWEGMSPQARKAAAKTETVSNPVKLLCAEENYHQCEKAAHCAGKDIG